MSERGAEAARRRSGADRLAGGRPSMSLWGDVMDTEWAAIEQHDFWCQVAIAALLQHDIEYDGNGHWLELCAGELTRCTLHAVRL